VPVSGIAVLAGVLTAYGAFAVMISIVAAFANGAHSHQVLSGATWKQLGTGGGIVAGIVLFLVWAAGGFVAARMAGHDGLRHGVWVFIVGVVLITVVGAAITWLPDTTAILRNLRLLGLPLRRNEWRDVGTVAGIASLVGMGAGAAVGGWFGLREPGAPRAAAPAPARERVAPPPRPPAERPKERAKKEKVAEPGPEPIFSGPSLFEQAAPETEPEPEQVEAPSPAAPEREPVAEEEPAWLQFVQERKQALHERDRDSGFEEVGPAEPAPWAGDEPVPTFIEEPVTRESEPSEATGWWPEQAEAVPGQAPAGDEAWALPDDEGGPTGGGETEFAFPPPGPAPVHERGQEPEAIEVPPLGEHADWEDDREPYRTAPEPTGDDALEQTPEAPLPEVDPEEQEERRRQQEEAARAYEQMRDEQ
jgi:hypothetical protein